MNITKHVAVLGLILGCFCFGCGKSALEPTTRVPIDCQKLLDEYFEAVKSKDVGKIQEFSSYISHAQSEGMPDGSLEQMRETKRRFAAEGFERMNEELGDFQSYSVLSAKETTITRAELVEKKMQGMRLEGIHAEITCKAKFSKKNPVLIRLNLFKETQASEYFIEAWQYQAEP